MTTRKNLLALIALLLPVFLVAQITEEEKEMSQGTYSALVTDMPGIDDKGAAKVWKNYAKQYGKVLRDKKSKEHYVLDVIVPSIDPEYAISIFVKLEEFADMTRATQWIKSDGEFINSTDKPAYADGAKAFLAGYALEVKKVVTANELKSQEKALKSLEKELAKLEKKNKSLHKDIEKAKEVIAKSEKAIEENVTTQEQKMKEIKEQQEKVAEVTSKLKGLGKDK